MKWLGVTGRKQIRIGQGKPAGVSPSHPCAGSLCNVLSAPVSKIPDGPPLSGQEALYYCGRLAAATLATAAAITSLIEELLEGVFVFRYLAKSTDGAYYHSVLKAMQITSCQKGEVVGCYAGAPQNVFFGNLNRHSFYRGENSPLVLGACGPHGQREQSNDGYGQEGVPIHCSVLFMCFRCPLLTQKLTPLPQSVLERDTARFVSDCWGAQPIVTIPVTARGGGHQNRIGEPLTLSNFPT